MSAAVHRSERHGSINWGRRGEGRGGEETLHHSLRGTGLRKTGRMIRKSKSTHLLHKINEEISDIFCVG